MSIWSKVLVGLILASVLPFFYLSVRLLKTNQAWRTQVNAWEKKVREAEDGNPAAGKLSLHDLARAVENEKIALHDVVADRGRVWTGVKPERAFSAAGEGAVIVDAPNPHQIRPKMIVFAFSGGNYLGEFFVTEVAEAKVGLRRNLEMSDRQMKRLAAAPGEWTLTEVMPIDRHDVFVGVEKETLEKALPKESLDAYLKDGQPAEPNDPPDRVVDGKYERQLHDYGLIFHEMDREITVAIDLREAAKKDAASLAAAVADALKQQAFHEETVKELKAELAHTEKERTLIDAEQQALSKSLTATRAEIKACLAENRQLAVKWSNTQNAAAQEINKRAPAPAQ
ncbi:MAG TPA: hypothetical protein VGJ26_15495 [Pirellulales bacterium]|jgi:hypothetical protein